MADGGDLMTRLPERLSICILEHLDAETLFNCTEVSRTWNEMTDRLQPRIWFEACLNAGIDVEEDTYHVASEWKAFFLTMVQRLRDMRTCSCYETFYYTFKQPVRAISCHNQKLAVAFSTYVGIMDMTNDREECILPLPCNFESPYLKFDGKTLVLSSTDGHISCWSFVLGNIFHDLIFFERKLLSIDFLTEYCILVGSIDKGDCSSIICICRILGEHIFRKITVDNVIHKVLLAPKTDSPAEKHQRKTCFLFCLAEDCVWVWIVEMRSRSFSVQVSTVFVIPSDPVIRRDVDVDGTPHFGLLFDGTELFFTTQSPERSRLIMWAWNFRDDIVRWFESALPIINLLGVGKKYLVYKLRGIDDREDIFCAVDKITNYYASLVKTDRIPSSNSYISLGHTSWMDGLNGENDTGVVLASLQEDPTKVDVVSYAPRHE